MCADDNQDVLAQTTVPSFSSQRYSDIQTGLLLKNRYVIERELGKGGIAVVYLARDNQLHSKPVVIKFLLQATNQNRWHRKRFYREVEALSRIDHPGIVGIIDAGQLGDGTPYMVMQYIDGVSLRSLIKADGMDYEYVSHIMHQLGDALSAVHNKGIHHRDLKPENIMLQSQSWGDDIVKLIDFNIATVMDSKLSTSQESELVAGTISYMAPEQLNGKPSQSSDIFALGVIAYEMLTGRRPFIPDSPFQLLEMQRQGVRVKPRDLRQGLPEAAQDVILKALSFEPKDRHAQARDFSEELAQALHSEKSLEKTRALTPKKNLSSRRIIVLRPKVPGSLWERISIKLYVAFALAVISIIGVVVYTKLNAEPSISTIAFDDDFDVFNPNRWEMPRSGWTVQPDGRLHLESAPIVGFPKHVSYRDLFMTFHLKLTNAGGAAWAVRVKDSDNYYLFYLSGPEGLYPGRFNTYIVQDGKFDQRNHADSVPIIIQLKAGNEYELEIKVSNNLIEHKIIPGETGKEMQLGSFRDPKNVFPYGSVGFRTVGPEKFSVDELYVIPPDSQ